MQFSNFMFLYIMNTIVKWLYFSYDILFNNINNY